MTDEPTKTDPQTDFDLTIGQLDRVLSKVVNYGRAASTRRTAPDTDPTPLTLLMDDPNQQTLKHHAEDMIAAGHKILKDLGKDVQGTPQPAPKPVTPEPNAPCPCGRGKKFKKCCGKKALVPA